MKLDLIEIANIPYRNHKAEIYSAKVRKRCRLKGIFYSILLGLAFGIFFGFCHIKSVASSDGAEIMTPRLVEVTYYLPTGSNCANTKPPHEGIAAFTPEYIGDAAIIYESENGTIGDLIGIYEMTPDDIALEEYYDSLELLACCVEAEAGNQGLIGKKYVVDVVLNRADDADYPGNITDVIMQQNQFSVVLDGRIWEVEPTEETFQAVREELEHRTNNEVLFFTSEGYSQYGTDWKKIGDHYFSRK